MTQYDWGTMVPTDSGLTLVGDLNSYRDAVNSTHRGAAAPTYKVAGMQWINDSVIPWTVSIYDGAQWIQRYEIDPTLHLIRHRGGPHIQPPGMASPAPTAAGEVWYDTNRPRLLIGTGSSTAFFSMCQWEYLHKGPVSAATNVDFYFTPPYKMIRVSYRLIPSAAASIYVRLSEDFGFAFISTNSYRHLYRLARPTGAVMTANAETASGFRLNHSHTIASTTGLGTWGQLTICELEGANKFAWLTGGFQSSLDNTPVIIDSVARTINDHTVQATAAQIITTAGTMTGWVSVEGTQTWPQS